MWMLCIAPYIVLYLHNSTIYGAEDNARLAFPSP